MTLTEKIRLVNSDKSLSKGAKLLSIEIIIASNFRGYCWHSVATLGQMISASESQVHRYIREAQEVGWIEVKRRPKKTSLYSLGEKFGPLESGVSDTAPKIEIKKNKTVQDGFSFQSSKQQPYPLPLVNDILRLTGDRKSIRYWIGVVKKVPESEIREAMSFLRIAMGEKNIAHPGAYLNSLILKHHPELRKPPTVEKVPKKSTPPKLEPEIIPASHEFAKAAIADILSQLNRKVG